MELERAQIKDGRKERTACQEASEANLEKMETNPEMMQSIGEHQEVPKEEAAVRSSGALKKRHRDRNQAAERRQKPKERNRGNCGYRKRLAVAGRKMIRRARVAWRTRNFIRKYLTPDKVDRGARRVRTLRKRLRTHQEGRMGIKNLGGRRPLCLRKERTTAKFIGGWSSGQKSSLGSGGILKKSLYEIVSVKIAKQIAGSYDASRKIKDGALWSGRPPPQR
jgi:hypothetical protein